MADNSHPFMDRVYAGHPVDVGQEKALYEALLMDGETVEMEFKGVRDGALFTDRRLLVYNKQGLLGKKIEFTTFPWKSITAFSVENSGTFDLDAEFKVCGSGWGVCEVIFTKGTDVRAVLKYMNGKVFGD